MKSIAKNILLFLAVIAAWFVLFSVSGCGSRKKEVTSSESKIDYQKRFDSLAEQARKVLELTKKEAQIHRIQNEQKIEAEVADGKSLRVDQYGPDGKLLGSTVFLGDGKAKTNASQKQSKKNLTETVSRDESSSSKTRVGSDEKLAASDKNFHSNLNRTGGLGFWGWFWIILAIIIVIIIIYLRWRFKTFSAIKNSVLNVFSRENTLAKNSDNED